MTMETQISINYMAEQEKILMTPFNVLGGSQNTGEWSVLRLF